MRRRGSARRLTLAQHLALSAYAPGILDDFASPDHAREAWESHRDTLLAQCAPAERPTGWWVFDSGRPDLAWPDPAEPIDPDAWTEPAQRPAVEMPAPTEATIRARHEAEARELRHEQRRREYLRDMAAR